MTEIPIVLLFESQITNIGGSGGEAFTIPFQRRYTGSRIFGPLTNLLSWKQEATGNIVDIQIWLNQQNTSATPAIFNLRRNGVNLLAGAGRVSIGQNLTTQLKSGLSLPVEFGDDMEISVEQAPSIGIPTPITVLVRTEVT